MNQLILILKSGSLRRCQIQDFQKFTAAKLFDEIIPKFAYVFLKSSSLTEIFLKIILKIF